MDVSAVIILAAGKSRRMKTGKSKLLHPLLGQPLIKYPLALAQKLKPQKIVLVVNRESPDLRAALSGEKVEFALQLEPRGTADAVTSALPQLKGLKGSVLILYGDDPLLTLPTLKKLVRIHTQTRARLSLLTAEYPEPPAFGRIVRDGQGRVVAIVEEADATPAQKAIKEVNAGVYCVELDFLKAALAKVRTQNRQKEYYLTDMVGLAVGRNLAVSHFKTPDYSETLGVNSRSELARASSVLQHRIAETWMAKGVTIEYSCQVFIGPEVTIGPDTELEAGARLIGKTRIGKNCRIQAGARIEDSVIEDHVEVRQNSVIERSVVKAGASIGPMAHLRPGSVVGKKARIGNFVELKKARLGEHSYASHLTYLGDAVIGKEVNIGAGVITCNYDGVRKYQTTIGDGVFVGSDSQFVAPVRIGKGAYIGSGSTITEDVPKDALAIARGRQVVKPGWAKAWRRKNNK